MIQKLIEKHVHEFENVFNTDTDVVAYDNAVGERIDDLNDEIELCDFFKDVITPTSARNKDGVELYIFNTATHRQIVRVSMCRSKGRSCNAIASVPLGYRTECKQQFVHHDLLSLSRDGTQIKETFPFPACCSCTVIRE